MSRQKTIKQPAQVEGRGLFGGLECRLRFVPAEPDTGIVFVRPGEGGQPARIPALIDNVAVRSRRTSLANGEATVETVEHVLSAVWGLQIDNIVIESSADEVPSMDGSSQVFVQALDEAGLREQDAQRRPYVIEEAISVAQDETSLAALPGPTDYLDILYDLDYGGIRSIGRQIMGFRLGRDDFARQIAPSRTFLMEEEAAEFQAAGIGTHLTPRDLLVMREDGPVDNELRFPDEHVRHKICDLIGDLAVLGRPLCGRIVAHQSGHELNHELVRRLAARAAGGGRPAETDREPAMDIRKVMRLLPHRYPFLMVDRVLLIDGDRRAVGIKNVTINEPFFEGHYPGHPIMPGVMILEALAQMSGILLSRQLEHTGKVAILLSMDRVKMRRPVRPGDQLVLEAESLHIRARAGHCRCRALVGGEVAAEAEIKFMLVDPEPI